MDKNQLYELTGNGEQRRNVELKRSMAWEDAKPKIVKALLAFSNIQDGGYLILGFSENNNSFEPTGMLTTDLATYSYDDVKSFISPYADPYVEFSMDIVKDEEENKKFLVFTIQEFEEIPVICKQSGFRLEEGAIYTRSRKKPETVKVPTQSEMREIIDMAIGKGLRKYIEVTSNAGLTIGMPAKEDEYDKELEDIL
jgi:predicted HTH transcriptional regulator